MAHLFIPLLLLVAVLVLPVAAFGALVLRRTMLSRGLGAFDCSLRHETIRRRSRWMHGVARYQDDRLDWFRVFMVRLRPAESLSRRRLAILDSREPEPADSYSVLPGWVVVRCAYGAVIVELAMSEGAFNGLAAWLESAPPGQHIAVTS
jgi:Protein of unknown function (DUF2550)